MRGLVKRSRWWSTWRTKNSTFRLSPYEVDHNQIIGIRPWKLNLTNKQLRKEAQERCHQT